MKFFAAEFDDVLRVHKLETEFFCKDKRIEILASRRGVITCRTLVDACLHLVENGIDVKVDSERANDILEAFSYHLKGLRAVALFLFFVEASVQSVGDLDVCGVALPRSGNDDIFSLRIAFDDIDDSRNGFAVRHRRSTEFANFHILTLYYSMHQKVRRQSKAEIYLIFFASK